MPDASDAHAAFTMGGVAYSRSHLGAAVIDLVYVVGTIAFFALMLAYVRGCEALGHTASVDTAREETSVS